MKSKDVTGAVDCGWYFLGRPLVVKRPGMVRGYALASRLTSNAALARWGYTPQGSLYFPSTPTAIRVRVCKYGLPSAYLRR